MPLNLAVTKGDAAEEIIRVHPKQSFVLGGHSLGGVMASRYAIEHADQLEGVFSWLLIQMKKVVCVRLLCQYCR